MTERKFNPATVKILSWLIILYGIAGMIYGLYETMESRGIAGFIMAREIAWFGGASFAFSYCLDLVIIFVPSSIVAFVLGVTIFPSLGDALLGLFIAKPKPSAGTTPVLPQQATGAMTWAGIGKAMVVMFGLTGAVAAVLYFLNVREQSLGVYQLNLDATQSALPARIGFIQLTGMPCKSWRSPIATKVQLAW